MPAVALNLASLAAAELELVRTAIWLAKELETQPAADSKDFASWGSMVHEKLKLDVKAFYLSLPNPQHHYTLRAAIKAARTPQWDQSVYNNHLKDEVWRGSQMRCFAELPTEQELARFFAESDRPPVTVVGATNNSSQAIVSVDPKRISSSNKIDAPSAPSAASVFSYGSSFRSDPAGFGSDSSLKVPSLLQGSFDVGRIDDLTEAELRVLGSTFPAASSSPLDVSPHIAIAKLRTGPSVH
ncbi:hypothetical protein EIP91_007806 [Steccherinum ochraceum]|uniref:Uncharacterized protein n=1 Tax=Steccherinum ochraceum TaxID=92696 RepID=A0A4R0RE06_9APHY|nr:hypothetical protein EIP91_007806 [Steccherinum ochraceum]